MRSWFPCVCWLMLAGCQSGSKSTASFAAPPPAVSPSLHASAHGAFASADYGKLPLAFEPNVGQTDARVQFLARGSGYSLFLGRERAVLELQRGQSHASAIEMELLGASTGAAPGAGREPLPGKVNYYRGSDPKQWHENVPTYAKVAYPGVYPGIDLVYYGRGGELEYDFVVRPGADSARIHLRFGGGAPTLDAKGDLVVSLDGGEVRLPKPVVYQEKNGRRQPVDGRFVLAGDHEVRFEVAAYDPRLALVIDPAIVYSTYLGGSGADGSDLAFGLAVDSAGSAIVVGKTPSSTFPTTTGALSTTFETKTPYEEAFVTKLSPDGTSFVFSTFLGGSASYGNGAYGASSWAWGVAVGPQDNIYVTGAADACSIDGHIPCPSPLFPTTAGCYQSVEAQGGPTNDWPDVFVTKFTPDGTLLYSTLVGGSGFDWGLAIAVDSSGNAYVAGATNLPWDAATIGSGQIPFPTTSNAYLAPFPLDDAGFSPSTTFVFELNPAGSQLLYSTLFGPTVPAYYPGGNGETGSGDSNANAIAVGTNGRVYIGGRTSQKNFPTTPGAFQSAPPAAVANLPYPTGFLAAFDTTKSGAASLVYSTYLGGPHAAAGNGDAVYGVAVDPDGNLYATGSAGEIDFPTTAGAFGTACVNSDAGTCPGVPYVAKLNPTGTALVYSTFLSSSLTAGPTGGLLGGFGYGIALDPARNAYVFGGVLGPAISVLNPLPAPDGGDTATTDNQDAFLATVSADGSRLLFASYLGGSGGRSNPSPTRVWSVRDGWGGGIALDKNLNVYVSSSTDASNFPITAGAAQPKCGSSACGGVSLPLNVYITKISPVGAGAPQDGRSDGAAGASDASTDGGPSAEAGSSGLTGIAANDAGAASAEAGAASAEAGAASAEAGAAGDNPVGAGRVVHKSGGDCNCGVAANDARGPGLAVLALLVTVSRRRRRLRRS
jgi:hypothetical protein